MKNNLKNLPKNKQPIQIINKKIIINKLATKKTSLNEI